MTELTPQERDALICDCANSLTEECPAHGDNDQLWIDAPAFEIVDRVERIVAARVTAAQADAWDERDKASPSYLGPNDGHYDDCLGWEDCYCASYPNPYLAAGREQATP